MEIRVISDEGARVVPLAELPDALADPDALVWVDIPDCDDEATTVLREVFSFHPVAIRECLERQRVPKVHAYPDHVFLVLHAPERGKFGHIHYVELDQFIGPRYLVTVHGPTNPAVPRATMLRDTSLVWDRYQNLRAWPTSPIDISHAIVSSVAREMEDLLETVTEDVWSLEQRVTSGHMGDAEAFLDEMFRTRHGLLAVHNITSTSIEIYERMVSIARRLTLSDRELHVDSIDQFRRVNHIATDQRDYLQGIIEFYRTRTDTKMTIAAERLAVIAVVTLPITALASILGMNLIVNVDTDAPLLGIALGIMAVMSAVLLRWAHKRGWW